MNPLHFHRPATLEDALALFRASNDARYIAGGMTLVPAMKAHLLAPEDLIDLSKLPELQGITLQEGRIRIGASVTHAAIAASTAVRETLPALSTLAGKIADRHVRNRGTLGGSLANNDPAADYPAAALALGATIITAGRAIAADDFFTGLFETALEDGEIIIAVDFPLPSAATYAKHPHPASGYAVAGVFAARFGDRWRLAVTGSGAEGVFRMTAMEAALAGKAPVEELGSVDLGELSLIEDRSVPADYRRHLIRLLAKRAMECV